VSGRPSRESFAERLNTRFAMRADDAQPFEAELIDVKSLASGELQESFSLMFLAPVDVPPSQGSYRLEHETLPASDVFLVPVKRDDDGLYFEAVFNYLLARS
jgi:hypothetical protein